MLGFFFNVSHERRLRRYSQVKQVHTYNNVQVFYCSVFCQCQRESKAYLLVWDETSRSAVEGSNAPHLFAQSLSLSNICIQIEPRSEKSQKQPCAISYSSWPRVSAVIGVKVKRAETHNNCSDQWIWKRTMGSGLGLICDKTHRVLSSLVGKKSKFLSKIKSQLPIKLVWLFENHISLLCRRLPWGNALLARRGPSTGKYFKRTQRVCVGYLPNTKVCFCD